MQLLSILITWHVLMGSIDLQGFVNFQVAGHDRMPRPFFRWLVLMPTYLGIKED